MAPGPDWLALPEEIMESIASRLTLIIDYIRFGCVCKTWRFVVLNNQQKQKLPFLVLPTFQKNVDRTGNTRKSKTRRVYSLSESKVVSHFKLPLPHDDHCLGSVPGGWLLTKKVDDYTISLFNPFSWLELRLPPLPPTDEFAYSIHQAFFFSPIAAPPPSSPDKEDSVVMIIYGFWPRLAFCRLSQLTWAFVDESSDARIHDVILYKGEIYAVEADGTLLICDINSPMPELFVFAERPDYEYEEQRQRYHKRFLVQSISGTLLQVVGFYIYPEVESLDFIVFELQPPEEKGKGMRWVRVTHLGDQILFLGGNNSLCLSASDFPSFKGNRIYFTISKMFLPNEKIDNGFFDLADKSVRPNYRKRDDEVLSLWSFWVMPPLICPSKL